MNVSVMVNGNVVILEMGAESDSQNHAVGAENREFPYWLVC